MASARQVGEATRNAVTAKAPDAPPVPGRVGASEGARHTGESAESTGDFGRHAEGSGSDAKAPSSGRQAGLLGLGLATAARCGPQLTSPEGIEAQTCVLTQGADTWARTYYRNATGKALDSALSLMGPDGHNVQMRCLTGTDDEPATCETPRRRSEGGMDAYTAVTEFAEPGADGGLLLRSGSDSADVGGNSGVPRSS
ncbi:hypothetical protein [Streptomyces sp. NPDC046759]|uniref:hypothetical protein n=1 Tax=Streptomyces sp. NPDC046759 TaxID=3155019 RepID=UPI00340B83A7